MKGAKPGNSNKTPLRVELQDVSLMEEVFLQFLKKPITR
jgi:hypothetical protein